jgi:hypothetical protein
MPRRPCSCEQARVPSHQPQDSFAICRVLQIFPRTSHVVRFGLQRRRGVISLASLTRLNGTGRVGLFLFLSSCRYR